MFSDDVYYNCFSQKKVKNLGNIFVGDFVEFDKVGEDFVIKKVMERKNKLIRPFVTNITQIFIVLSSEPEPDFVLIDKLIINAIMNKIKPILVVNKCDLKSNIKEIIEKEYLNSNIERIFVSSKEKTNIDELKNMLLGNITAFAGQSGTGKTSLINVLFNHTGEVGKLSDKIMRGKNTTRNAELLVINNETFVLDTAGFSKIEFSDMNPNEIKNCYNEFNNCECVYKNCNHIYEGENKCGVIKSVGKVIDKNRYERYKLIFMECDDLWRKRYD